METHSKVSGGNKSLQKRQRGGHLVVRTPKIFNFTACKPQDNEHEIRIAFFERDLIALIRSLQMNITGK